MCFRNNQVNYQAWDVSERLLLFQTIFIVNKRAARNSKELETS